jgi:hypothetical protein
MKKKTEKAEKVNERPQIEVKLIKHSFTEQELNDLGMQLAKAHQALNEIAGEFDQVKANFKAREAEQSATITRATSARLAGFEMRNARCRVAYRPKERVKDFYLEFAGEKAEPVLTEPMTDGDMQAHLLPDEPKFEKQEAIKLWRDGEIDSVMTVGMLAPELCGKRTPMWFAALALTVGQNTLIERLDNDQPCATKRIDIIRRAAKRCKAWLMDTLGKEAAEGFTDGIDEAVEEHKERAE